MTDLIITHEPYLRFGVFVSVLFLMIIAETVLPKKARTLPRAHRWLTNFLFVAVDTIFVRLLFPIVAVGVAIIATEENWGLFNLTALPIWIEVFLAIIVLDMMIYWQHVASHHIPVLWRMHKVHHADRDIDVTTGSRFHPIEIGLSMGYKMLLVVLLGPPVLAVILFEIILNGCAMFNHSNIKLPVKADRVLRWFIVTPDMHRIHHSTKMTETNSNFGFSLSLWDRLFGSYIQEPEKGHDGMKIGLSEYQDKAPASLIWSLVLPFKSVKQFKTWL